MLFPPAARCRKTRRASRTRRFSKLRKQHQLKDGAWGLLALSAGSLRFVWDDDAGGAEELEAPASLVVPPEVLHHVEGDGPFELTITFYRA